MRIFKLQINANGGANYEYSFDGIEWTEYDGENDPEFTDKIYVRAYPQEKLQINCSKDFRVGGNAMSLLYGSEFTGEEIEFPEDGTFDHLFSGSKLLDARALILPATTLVKGCYEGMFGSSNLLGAPELPAKSFADGCYNTMFSNTKINEVKIHIEGEWDSTCTGNWLDGVVGPGVLYNLGGATGIPTNDASGCPDGWTIYPNPNTVPGEEPSNPIDVTGTELEQLLEQDPVQGVQDMGGMQGVPMMQYVQGSYDGTQGTQGAPEEEEEEEELKPIRDKKSSTPQTAQIGYFYNVTKPSTRFAKGVYTIIDKSNAVPFTAVVSEKELAKLMNEKSLVPDTTYFVLSSKGNMVCYAKSTKDADKIFQQPTGWTPKNPIMVTGQELDDLIDRDLLNDGYFYNITDTTGTEYDTGLYVAVKGDVEPFDWNNMVTSDQLSQMAADEELTPNAIYYISDYYDDKETDAVVWADSDSTYGIIERSRTPKPIPEPEPKVYSYTISEIEISGTTPMEEPHSLKQEGRTDKLKGAITGIGNASVYIYDTNNQVIFKAEFVGGVVLLDFGNYQPAEYRVQFIEPKGSEANYKVIKKEK